MRPFLYRNAFLLWSMFLSSTAVVDAFSGPRLPQVQRGKIIARRLSNHNGAEHSPSFSTTSLSRDAALALVPPDQVWDTLQRARHYASDITYQKWPPCIRLLHPFTDKDDAALTIAEVIDKYQIAPFEIRLTEWSVIPHAEAMEADWRAMQMGQTDQVDQMELDKELTEEEQEIQDLIAREEYKGRVNLKKRQQRMAAKERLKQSKSNIGQSTSTPLTQKQTTAYNPEESATNSAGSPKDLWEKQKQMYEEFNGPCVVCLEPDEDSRNRIMELRSILLEEAPELQAFASYSATLTHSDIFPFSTSTFTTDYRPIVPVASFPTVTAAVEMARKLRNLWDPLEFDVTELHVVSRGGSLGNDDDLVDYAKLDSSVNGMADLNYEAASWASHVPGMGAAEEDLSNIQIGCDALIMLAGEEVDMDNELNEEMANMIAKEGYSGGASRGSTPELQEEAHDGLNLDDGDVESIYEYLDEEDDEDYDDGAVVVIGRTHFFTGEMRSYVGMPATSAMDAKDRAYGGSVSGAARRQRAFRRATFNDGDWGTAPPKKSASSKQQSSQSESLRD